MDARSIIGTIRDGEVPSAEALRWFANGLADGRVSDAQAGAFAMAALVKGLGERGRVDLTEAMRDSGDVLTWDLPGPVVDKHSTGGVGDAVSFLLAPMLAACGVFNPMISGRGLGHTGGTLDKLETIPGVCTSVSEARFREIVSSVGCAIVSATGDLAPADRRLYAVRDVTATVESIDLITASILSKKLAAGLDALVLDVKVGSGAFLPEPQSAKALAEALVATSLGAGCKASALLTDMNQPLAPAAGNAVEISLVLDVLTGTSPGDVTHARLIDVAVALVAEVLALAGVVGGLEAGLGRARTALQSGQAAEVFEQMIAALGGPRNLLTQWRRHLPVAPVVRPILAGAAGYITSMDTKALGLAIVQLGGGRMRGDDVVNPSVGLSQIAVLGAKVEPDTPLAMVHATDDSAADAATKAVRAAMTFGDAPADTPPLHLGRVA